MSREGEEILATVIEAVLATERTTRLGCRRRRDGTDDSGLTVDFTYDQATPPVAMEITSIEDSHFLSSGDASSDLAMRLNDAVEKEGLRPFTFTIKASARVRELDSLLIGLMRTGTTIPLTGYTSNDLGRWRSQGTLEENVAFRRRLEAIGLVGAEPSPQGAGVTIVLWPTGSGFRPVSGLAEIIAANINKLRQLPSGYERHLVVYVAAYGISAYPAGAEVPQLPSDLNRVWVLHDKRDGSSDLILWSLVPHQREWRVHDPVRARTS